MEDQLLNGIKDRYLKRFIESKKNNTQNQFPMESVQKVGMDFHSYVDNVDDQFDFYSAGKSIYAGDEIEFMKFILNKLKEFRDDKAKESFDILKKFFLELEYPSLNAGLKDKFDKAIEILVQSINYFCSYTTKGLPEINSIYKEAVTDVFGIDNMTPEWKSNNYIAKLIVRYLNNHGMSYFFDQDSIINGEKIESKVFEYCGRAIVLVILAQQETFEDKTDRRNWCFEEYQHYTTIHAGKCHLIVYRIPTLSRPAGARTAIRRWYDYISTTDGIKNTTLQLNWPSSMIKQKVDVDADIIVDAYTKEFNDFVYNIS